MGYGESFLATALLAAVVFPPGSGSIHAQQPGASQPDATERVPHDGHDHRMDGGPVRLVHYRSDQGFVPDRLDVVTGTRVVLIDETGGQLEPRFGAGDPGAHGGPDSHGGPGGHDGHGGHDRGAAPVWLADASVDDGTARRFAHTFENSGYWRFHNAAAPGDAALVVALTPPGEKPPPLVMKRDELPAADPPEMTVEDFTVLLTDMERLRETMETYGPGQALELLRLGEVETGIDCHAGAHHLGRMAFAEYGAAAAAGLAEACQSGMRHGVMEQLFVERGIANLAYDVDSLCPGADNAFGRHQCFHGVGHGVMAWTAYELEDALGICGRLGDDSGRRSCYSGVFMENVVSGLSGAVGQRSTYVDAEDPHYPCNALPERYVSDCYWYQTSQMLNVFGQDLEMVAEACREAPATGRRACFGSYGRDVGAAHRGNPYLVVQYCLLPESLMHQGDCIDGAARTLFWDVTQQDAGVALCADVERPIVAESCWQAVVNQAHAVSADLGPFCGRLPDRWRERCMAP